MFTNTPDGHFIVEKHDDWPVVIAGGFSGHGYKFCSVVGEIIANLIRGECDFNIELFSSHRFR
jgi:sarcosine oxidase